MSKSQFPGHNEQAVHVCCMDGRHTLKQHRRQVEQTYPNDGLFQLTSAGGILAVLLSSEGGKLLGDLELAANLRPTIKIEGHAHDDCAWLRANWLQLQQAGYINPKLSYDSLTLDQEHGLLDHLLHQAHRIVESRFSGFPEVEFTFCIVSTKTGQYLQKRPAMAK